MKKLSESLLAIHSKSCRGVYRGRKELNFTSFSSVTVVSLVFEKSCPVKTVEPEKDNHPDRYSFEPTEIQSVGSSFAIIHRRRV